jgi:hypothetical protein
MEKLKQFWEDAKRWFNRSLSILHARITMLLGLVTTVAGTVDWSALITGVQTGMNRTALLITGGLLFIQGLTAELARRANTKVIAETGQLIPANVEVKKVK